MGYRKIVIYFSLIIFASVFKLNFTYAVSCASGEYTNFNIYYNNDLGDRYLLTYDIKKKEAKIYKINNGTEEYNLKYDNNGWKEKLCEANEENGPNLIYNHEDKNDKNIYVHNYSSVGDNYYKNSYDYHMMEGGLIQTDEGDYKSTSPDSEYCYYTSGDLALKIKYNKNKPASSLVLVDKWGLKYYNSNHEKVLNWGKKPIFVERLGNKKVNEYSGTVCPSTIAVVRYSEIAIKEFFVYANPINEIKNWCQEHNNNKPGYCYIYYGTYQQGMTEEQYNDFLYGSLNQSIVVGKDDSSSCSEIFGSISQSGYIKYAKDASGNDLLDNFGNKIIEEEYPPSLGYMIHQALSVARIIAIVLVIVLGILDFAKSVLAGKEDEMRKNQQKFVKRLIACVVIFLIPTIVSIIMNLVDETATLNVECMEETKGIIK